MPALRKNRKLGASTEKFQYIFIYREQFGPVKIDLTKELHVSGEMAEQGAPTASIGIYLKEKHGSKPPDTHIGCFYIKLGQEICQYPMILLHQAWTRNLSVSYDSTTSNCYPQKYTRTTEWGKTEPGWDGVFFFNAPETTKLMMNVNTKKS